jgi:predicted nucleic acid-binding protein
VLEETIRLLPVEADDHRRMRDLMKKYRMLPMDLADAALVTVAERERIRRIFTIDRRDFSIYRPVKLGKFMIIP